MTEFKRLSIQDANTLIENEEVTLADIRDEASFNQSRLKNAHHVNNSNLQAFIETADLDKPLIIYCYHGNSSLSAAQFLSEKGFDDVYSLDGGFEAWRTQFTIESP
jgi:thiosulfate sulfurtransferase